MVEALMTAAVVLTGTLAPADPLVLGTVEVRRVWNGWGLDHFAGVGVVRLAVDDCDLLGAEGWLLVDGTRREVYVVDCCSQPGCLTDNGLVADVSVPELGHRKATVVLWQSNEKQKTN